MTPGPATAEQRAPEERLAIRTERLTKRYGEVTAVDRLNLKVRAGEIFGLLGPNGAGKTTTILMLLGLTEPTDGKAEVVGLDPARHPLEVKSQVGYLPDNVGFYGNLTGRENLRYTARLNGLRGAEAEERIEGLLGRVGLTEAADGKVETYSRGMRQRLGIADALVKGPDVLILDEPTANIDPQGVADILALIHSLARERGVAMLISSHLLHQVQEVCDRVAIFRSGKIVGQGTMAALARKLTSGRVVVEVTVNPVDADVAAILSGVPNLTSVEHDAYDPALWRVTSGIDPTASVVGALVGAGVKILQVRRAGEELDEIYQSYFSDEGPNDGRRD
jgi:ABC-2 type transport system ATP-binding protein